MLIVTGLTSAGRAQTSFAPVGTGVGVGAGVGVGVGAAVGVGVGASVGVGVGVGVAVDVDDGVGVAVEVGLIEVAVDGAGLLDADALGFGVPELPKACPCPGFDGWAPSG